MEISKLIRNQREALNMSQEEFARMVGCSRQSVVWWETGKFIPSVENLERVGITTIYKAVGGKRDGGK